MRLSELLAFGMLTVFLVGASELPGRAEDLKPIFPGANCERAKPEAASTSSARLEVLRSWLKTQKTTAMMIVVGGRSIFEYGDVTKATKVASVRKSILAMLYGKYVTEGKIDLDKNVKELGLDDVKPFLPIEERATLLQLMTARSGIYHESANSGLDAATPKRGSQTPGTYFQYNNWDFNAVGTAFEKLVGRNLYDVLESDLAKPFGMQDFDRSRQKKISSMPQSVHPEYAMYLSTRDHGSYRAFDAPRGPVEWQADSSKGVERTHHYAGDSRRSDPPTWRWRWTRPRHHVAALGVRDAVVGLGCPVVAGRSDGTLSRRIFRNRLQRPVHYDLASRRRGRRA
jgi:CubicO group peptidase (beta-lactamase class C family)